MNNIYIIYVVFSEHKACYLDTLKRFAPFENILIINNNSRLNFKDLNCHKGTNKNREFSGYLEGFEKIKNKIKDDDIVIFCNDTFMSRRYFMGYFHTIFIFLAYFYRIFSNKAPFICGEVHKLNEKITKKNKIIIPNHISTYFFITNKTTVVKFISNFNSKLSINLNIKKSTFISPALDSKYIDRLNKWIFSEKNGWYNGQKPDNANKEFLIKKATSVFLEHNLALLSIERRIKLIPIYSARRYSISRFFLFLFNLYAKIFH